jgi:nucleotide-binding universal stress UspA family protein
MPWNLILAGVDPSPSGLRAAAAAHRLATSAGRDASCVLVHAVRDVWSAASFHAAIDVRRYHDAAIAQGRSEMLAALARAVPEAARWPLEVHVGRPARVLRDVAKDCGADVVIIGSKQHIAPVRWVGGSTAHEAARMLDVPLLVTSHAPAGFRRILGAVDVSAAADTVIAATEKLAVAHNASLRFVHVIEPIVFAGPGAEYALQLAGIAEQEVETLETQVWPRVTLPRAERVVRRGFTRFALAAEVKEWRADLLVVGAHGRGWVDRLVLGSMTQGVLTDLPCSVLVIPVHTRLGAEPREPSLSGAPDQEREHAPA